MYSTSALEIDLTVVLDWFARCCAGQGSRTVTINASMPLLRATKSDLLSTSRVSPWHLVSRMCGHCVVVADHDFNLVRSSRAPAWPQPPAAAGHVTGRGGAGRFICQAGKTSLWQIAGSWHPCGHLSRSHGPRPAGAGRARGSNPPCPAHGYKVFSRSPRSPCALT